MFWTYTNCSFQAFEMPSKLYLRCIPSIHQKNAKRPRLHSSCNVCHPQIHIAQGIITRASQDQIPIGSRSGTFSNGSAKSSRRQRDFDPRRSGPVFEDGDFFCLKEDGDFFSRSTKMQLWLIGSKHFFKTGSFSLLKSHNKQEVAVATAICCSSKGQTTGSRRSGRFR